MCEDLIDKAAIVDAKDKLVRWGLCGSEMPAVSLHWSEGVRMRTYAVPPHSLRVQKGQTPLHKAAMRGNIDACLTLIKHGARLHEPDTVACKGLGRRASNEPPTHDSIRHPFTGPIDHLSRVHCAKLRWS